MICKHDWVSINTICCEHKKCLACGAIKKVGVCDFHKEHLTELKGKEYFKDIVPELFENHYQNTISYIEEHEKVFEKIGFELYDLFNCLEVGAGTGKLAPLLLKYYIDYFAVEPNEWASNFIKNNYNIDCVNKKFEDVSKKDFSNILFNAVFCLHTLEHFEQADKMFEKLTSFVKDNGYLFIEIPDNTDLYNPNHKWFFDEKVLIKWGENIGLKLVSFYKQNVTCKENFLYYLFKKEVFNIE